MYATMQPIFLLIPPASRDSAKIDHGFHGLETPIPRSECRMFSCPPIPCDNSSFGRSRGLCSHAINPLHLFNKLAARHRTAVLPDKLSDSHLFDDGQFFDLLNGFKRTHGLIIRQNWFLEAAYIYLIFIDIACGVCIYRGSVVGLEVKRACSCRATCWNPKPPVRGALCYELLDSGHESQAAFWS